MLGGPGLSALLRSGALRVHCHALTTAQTGQSNLGGRTTPLPLSSYSFKSVRAADRKTYLHRCFQNVKPGPSLTYKESKRLKRDIASSLIDPVDTVRQEMDDQFRSDLRSSVPHFSVALAMELKRNYRIGLRPGDLALKIHELQEDDFCVESNLQSLTALNDLTCHKAIERALLAVSGLNQRLAEMNGYSALTDFWYRDLPVFGRKLRYLSELAPERADRALVEVLALPGLPDIADAVAQGRVDIGRFLEIRNSPDGQQFRSWFRNRGTDDIATLKDQWGAMRNKFGGWLATRPGKTLRFIVSTGAGLDPVAGVVVGAIDSFLLERWLPQSQPLTFLQHSYASIFRAPEEDDSGRSH